MQTGTKIAVGIGAVAGAVLGIAAIAVLAPRVITSGVDVVVLDAAGRARGTFVVTQGAMYVTIIGLSAVGGALIGSLGYAVGKEASPHSPRLALGPLAVVGAVTGIVIGFATARAAVGIGGDISHGIVTISVFRAIIVASITGATTGAVVAGGIERISRPASLGLAGEAWPASPATFMKDGMVAMGLPTLTVLIGLVLVGIFSQVLLKSPTVAALALFSLVATGVLAIAALIAANPPRSDDE